MQEKKCHAFFNTSGKVKFLHWLKFIDNQSVIVPVYSFVYREIWQESFKPI